MQVSNILLKEEASVVLKWDKSNEVKDEQWLNITFISLTLEVSKWVISKDLNDKTAKKPIREYVDQILDKNFEKIFSGFIIKLRDVYYKKISVAPLKAKKRIVVGMREIEKSIKLKNILFLFVVPNIEKVEGVKNSMDQRIMDIFENCRDRSIPTT